MRHRPTRLIGHAHRAGRRVSVYRLRTLVHPLPTCASCGGVLLIDPFLRVARPDGSGAHDWVCLTCAPVTSLTPFVPQGQRGQGRARTRL
ncbi:hypothetical protein [Deinococcus kurensis]|uniref:hypothetical protein n=1 Tax=Deinococcus kurensis TaxID=2662757 RepID=UPI0012D36CA3|nr:hypothetical protein [Deinococcus kurensis]